MAQIGVGCRLVLGKISVTFRSARRMGGAAALSKPQTSKVQLPLDCHEHRINCRRHLEGRWAVRRKRSELVVASQSCFSGSASLLWVGYVTILSTDTAKLPVYV